MLDDVATGAGFNPSNFVAMTGGIYAVPVPSPVPAVTVSPSTLTFASQNTGTVSAAQNVVLTNFGDAPLDIANIGTKGDFSESNNCGTTLPGASNCTIGVTYAPMATGTQTGTLTISDNAFTGTQTVDLSGMGTGPTTATPTATATATSTPTPTMTATPTATATAVPVTLKIAPTSLKFPRTKVGTPSEAKKVEVSNPKGSQKQPGWPVLIEIISNPGMFKETNDCPPTLAAGAVCSITVTFTPSEATMQFGSLVITDNAKRSPHLVPLSGKGK